MRAEDSITVIPGVGVKTAALYEKLGIVTVSDLLNNYPRAYEKYEEPITIREAAERDFAAVRVVPVSAPVVVRSSRVPFVTVTLTDREGGRMSAIWFRADWIRGAVRTGEEIVLRGRLSARGSRRVLTQPKIFSVEAYEQKTKTLQPVYTLTPGITAQAIAKHIRLVFDAGVTLPETLPDDLRARYGLMEKNEALRQIHFPEQGPDLLPLLPDVVEHPLEEAEDHLVLIDIPAHLVLGHQELFGQAVPVPHWDPGRGLLQVFRMADQVLEGMGIHRLDFFRPVHHFSGFQGMAAVGLEIAVTLFIHLEDLLCQSELGKEILEIAAPLRPIAFLFPEQGLLVGIDEFQHGFQVLLLERRLDQHRQQVGIPAAACAVFLLEGDFQFHQAHMVGKDIVGEQDGLMAPVVQTVQRLSVQRHCYGSTVPAGGERQVIVEVFPYPGMAGCRQDPFR